MAEADTALNFIQNSALPSYLAFIAKQAGTPRFIYASSCSVYGYTIGQTYDEESPVVCRYPYGVSKLQGEHGVMQLNDAQFSAIALRQGTVCGHSPRMRFDLIVNTMFRDALTKGGITINNPEIWRPLIDVRDTAAAFLRAVEADIGVSGVFNVARDNFTVGQVADAVQEAVAALTGHEIGVTVFHREDCRNYRVSCEKAQAQLGFAPRYSIADTVEDLFRHRAAYGDFSDDVYYNIKVFNKLPPRV
jgi:nucleoside-diphosphate-sugar epimerase